MARYIDADKFAKEICEFPAIDEHSANAIISLLHKQPTADVEEVVRCRNCKHRRETMHGSYCLPAFGLKQITDLDAFCSYGERRTNNDL